MSLNSSGDGVADQDVTKPAANKARNAVKNSGQAVLANEVQTPKGLPIRRLSISIRWEQITSLQVHLSHAALLWHVWCVITQKHWKVSQPGPDF